MTSRRLGAIDVHAHIVPPSLPRRIRATSSLPSVQVSATPDGRPVIALPRSPGLGPARPPIPGLLDMESTVTRMDAQEVDVAVVSIWPDLLGTDLPPHESVAWADMVNESLMESVRSADRLLGMACVPVQGDRPVEVMERAKKMGFVGFELGTRALSLELDSAELEPVWEAAAGLDMPVLVHPLYYGGDERLADNRSYGLANSIGRINDTTVAFSRLLLSGVLERYPALKIIVAHGGGAIPYVIGRLQTVHTLDPVTADPYLGFSLLYFDSIVFDPDVLAYLVQKAGPDHVLLASDHPFANGDPNPRAVVRNAKLDASDEELILGGNARRLFGLDVSLPVAG